MSIVAALLAKKNLLAARIEGTSGVAESSLASADSEFRVIDRTFSIKSAYTERAVQGAIGLDVGFFDGLSTDLSFKVHLTGPGSALAAGPNWATTFLPACACIDQSSNGLDGSNLIYKFTQNTSFYETITAGFFRDGQQFVGRGMMGDFSINLLAAKAATVDFKFMGGWEADPGAVAIPTGMTYETTIPPYWGGTGGLTFNGSSTAAFTFTNECKIEAGNKVSLRQSPGYPGGYYGGFVGDRIIKWSLDPDSTSFGTNNWWAFARAGSTCNISAVVGTTVGNIITLASTGIQLIDSPAMAEREGRACDKLVFAALLDNFTMTFS
jgi:hypothetical protein